LFFGEIAIHAFSFFTYPCKLQERETTRTKLEKKNLGIKKKNITRQQTYLKKQENVGIWIINLARLHQISFSYLTTSYPSNKEIKMSDHVKKIKILIKK
jgi:hypothetical protein